MYYHVVVCCALICKRVDGRGRVGKATLCCGSLDSVVTLNLHVYTRSRETNDLFQTSVFLTCILHKHTYKISLKHTCVIDKHTEQTLITRQ